MSFLTGTAPKATTQPTVAPQQGNILDMLSNILTSATGGTGGGQATQGALGSATDTGQNLLNIIRASGGAPGANYPTPMIDPSTSSQAFQQGVVEPMTQDFLQKTLPGIVGQFGGGAGGAYGSGGQQAKQQAATGLERTLAETGTQYTLGAEEANQQADLKAQMLRLTGLTDTSTIISQLMQAFNIPLADMIGLGTAQTQQTVGTGGSTGLLPSLLGGPAGAGLGSFIGSSLAGGAGAGAGIQSPAFAALINALPFTPIPVP